MPAIASLSLDDGIATSSWNATFALRMRVSMSAIGSVIVTARRLPSPRALRQAGHLACVRHLAQADAAQPEVAVHRARAPAAPAARIGAHLELRLALLLLNESLFRHRSPLAVAAERKPEYTHERAPVVVGCRRRHDCHVHAANGVDLVVVDLREHELLVEPERVVALAVELIRRHATKVSDAGDRQTDEPVVELPHAFTAQRHLGADLVAFAELEA